MGKIRAEIDDTARRFIEAQKIFFVASAPLDEPEFAALAPNVPDAQNARSVIVVEVTRVTDSCGYGVPLFNYEGERDQLTAWARNRGPEGLKCYRQEKNRQSIDGLPGVAE